MADRYGWDDERSAREEDFRGGRERRGRDHGAEGGAWGADYGSSRGSRDRDYGAGRYGRNPEGGSSGSDPDRFRRGAPLDFGEDRSFGRGGEGRQGLDRGEGAGRSALQPGGPQYDQRGGSWGWEGRTDRSRPPQPETRYGPDGSDRSSPPSARDDYRGDARRFEAAGPEGGSYSEQGYGRSGYWGTSSGSSGPDREREGSNGSRTESAFTGSAFQDLAQERGEELEAVYGRHRGRGPKGYARSDERIHEEVNERLTDDPQIDATDIHVEVSSGEVTLSGHVESRRDKRRAEDLIERLSGVRHVQNNLRVRDTNYNAATASAGGRTASGPIDTAAASTSAGSDAEGG